MCLRLSHRTSLCIICHTKPTCAAAAEKHPLSVNMAAWRLSPPLARFCCQSRNITHTFCAKKGVALWGPNLEIRVTCRVRREKLLLRATKQKCSEFCSPEIIRQQLQRFKHPVSVKWTQGSFLSSDQLLTEQLIYEYVFICPDKRWGHIAKVPGFVEVGPGVCNLSNPNCYFYLQSC